MFVDKASITIKAGDGGAGAVSFHREKYVAAGGPDGGDGGKGGDVVFVVDTNVNSLLSFKYKKRYFAQNGENGGTRQCSGKGAPDLVIPVPRGTVIREKDSGRILADISDDAPVVVAVGGKGGWGNQHFATPTRQIPRFAKGGLPGAHFEVELELKLLADVGLAGFPNVGKSTLVSVVSAAKPEIANYHFTTLSPVLGVVKIDEEHNFVIADIPGLIEGASEGVGLGHQFLRHVDRCRLIVHIVDVSGCEGRDPIEDFEIINRELENYSMELADRPMLVAGNKCDIATPEQIARFQSYVEGKGYRFYPISAAAQQGTRELMYAVFAQLGELPPIVRYEPDPTPASEELDKNHFEITVEDGVYEIDADWLQHSLGMVDMDDYESLQYFQRVLRSSGIIDRLLELGIQEGDTVRVLGYEFNFIN
ncbi:MAG: GTPase ObgE [Angelakisella sp.]